MSIDTAVQAPRALPMELRAATPSIDLEGDVDSPKAEKVKVYRPLIQRAGVIVGLGLVAGVFTSYILPELEDTPPALQALIMVPFINGFSKSGKKFLNSFSSLTGRAAWLLGFVGSAGVWDYFTSKDPSKIESWGLTALMGVTAAKAGIDKLAALQKPIKD